MLQSIFTLGAISLGPLIFEPVCAQQNLATPAVSALNQPEIIGPATDSDPSNCFPAIGFTMPTATPASLTNWWCNYDTEYAFVGFSYEVTDCEIFHFLTINLLMLTTIPFVRSEFDNIEGRLLEYQKQVQWKIRANVWVLRCCGILVS